MFLDNSCSNIGTGSEIVDVLNSFPANFDFTPKTTNMLDPEISFVNNSILNTYLCNLEITLLILQILNLLIFIKKTIPIRLCYLPEMDLVMTLFF